MPSVCCLFITICNCRTACLGWGGRTQFDFGSSMLHRFLPFSPVIANFASSIASFIILVLFFMVAYKVLPDKSLDFKSLSVGAIVTVILITIGKLCGWTSLSLQQSCKCLWSNRSHYRFISSNLLLFNYDYNWGRIHKSLFGDLEFLLLQKRECLGLV